MKPAIKRAGNPTSETLDPFEELRFFRASVYRCPKRHADALFELADSILMTSGSVSSPVHLSLAPVHRRGWGSLYAALREAGAGGGLRSGSRARRPGRAS